MKTRVPRFGSWGVVLVAALTSLVGCAPATMSPMVMRLGPGQPGTSIFHAGLRAGPRLSAPLAARTNPDSFDESFSGDNASFSTKQWSLAYDVALTKPLGEKLALHVGVQGEFYYPVPLPGYGLYMGVSSWYGTPNVGVAPALVLRGATDFGLSTRGGPGTILGAEASSTFYLSTEERVAVGLVPFLGIHEVFSREQSRSTLLYYGGAVVMQLPLGKNDRVELSAGGGRAKEQGGASWNVPILGGRWAH
jgi:hypothetical protein